MPRQTWSSIPWSIWCRESRMYIWKIQNVDTSQYALLWLDRSVTALRRAHSSLNLNLAWCFCHHFPSQLLALHRPGNLQLFNDSCFYLCSCFGWPRLGRVQEIFGGTGAMMAGSCQLHIITWYYYKSLNRNSTYYPGTCARRNVFQLRVINHAPRYNFVGLSTLPSQNTFLVSAVRSSQLCKT